MNTRWISPLEPPNADTTYPHSCSSSDHAILATAMIGIAKAMVDLRGREFFHGLVRGFKRARNHWQVMSDEPTN